MNEIKSLLRWCYGLIIGLFMLSYLYLIIDIYFYKPESLTGLYNDSIRILGTSDEIEYLKRKFIYSYLFFPLIQGSVFLAAVTKAMSLIYQSLLVPLFKRA